MAVGDTITAARYNIIRARIAAILGLGAGDEGTDKEYQVPL